MTLPCGKNDAAIKRAYRAALRRQLDEAVRDVGRTRAAADEGRVEDGRVLPAIEDTADDDPGDRR